MTVTISLWTKTTKFYKIGLVITIITFSSLALLAYFDPQNKPPGMDKSAADIVFAIVAIPCSIFSCLFLVIVLAYNIGKYQKDGELVMRDDGLMIDGVNIPLSYIKSINLKMSPRSRKTLWLGDNLITLIDANEKQYKRKFVIKSHTQNEDFEGKITAWRAQGLGIYAYYNGI